MTSQNIVILTGDDLRHQFFIHHLKAGFSISGIFIEKGSFPEPKPRSKDESIAWDWFFKGREDYEKKLVRDSGKLLSKNKPEITYLAKDELNSPQTIAKIKKMEPNFIAVFGTSILSQPFLNKFPQKLFNLHLGDPEFYRGSSCNFWPILDKKLHHLSATIHRIDQGIDTGEIFSKQTIIITEEDNEQTLVLKPLILGTKLMLNTLNKLQKRPLQTITQNKMGKLYKKADFTPEAVLRMKQMVESESLTSLIQEEMNRTMMISKV